MPKPIVCSIDEIINQVGPATLTGHNYAPVDIILQAIKPGTPPVIVFSLYGQDPTKTYEAQWGNTSQMWVPCPSTFPADADFLPPNAGDPPRVGAWGRLYMTGTYLAGVHVAMSPLDTKWPPKLAATDPLTNPLEIYPTKLTLSGVELRTGQFREATIDLLDPTQASAIQTIELDGTKPVRVALTQASFNKFPLPFKP